MACLLYPDILLLRGQILPLPSQPELIDKLSVLIYSLPHIATINVSWIF